MPDKEPTVQLAIFDGLEAFLADRDVELKPLLEASGLAGADFTDHTVTVSMNAMAQLLEQAAKATGDNCFALRFAETERPDAIAVVGQFVLNAPDFRSAVAGIARYARIVLRPVKISFGEAGGVGKLTWTFPDGLTSARQQFCHYMSALVLIRLRQAVDETWQPIAVELEHREPGCRDTVTRIFGERVKFNRPMNILLLDVKTLSIKNRAAKRPIFEMARELVEKKRAEIVESVDIVGMTRGAILEHLASAAPDLEKIAAMLEKSPRSLQAQLERAGTSYTAVLSDTRRQLAERHLRDTDMRLSEIAYAVGFSDLSAFTRAAKSWFGMAPSAYRQALRQSIAATGKSADDDGAT